MVLENEMSASLCDEDGRQLKSGNGLSYDDDFNPYKKGNIALTAYLTLLAQ